MKAHRRLAVLVGIYTLVVIVAGAVKWQLHAAAGFLLVAVTAFLGVWCLRGKQPLLRGAGVVALASAALECVPGASMIHACFAPVLFTAVSIAALFPATRPEGDKPPRGLQRLGATLPPLVFLQIVLGAAYRHKLIGVMAHMGGAMLVAGTILVACVLFLQRCPDQPRLRRAATAAISIVLLQVSLGITVFIMRLLDMDNSLVFGLMAATHICGAALMLAASTWLSLCVTWPDAWIEVG
jgi:heme A synthase